MDSTQLVLRVEVVYRADTTNCPLRAITRRHNGTILTGWTLFQRWQDCTFQEWFLPQILPWQPQIPGTESAIFIMRRTGEIDQLLTEEDFMECGGRFRVFVNLLADALNHRLDKPLNLSTQMTPVYRPSFL